MSTILEQSEQVGLPSSIPSNIGFARIVGLCPFSFPDSGNELNRRCKWGSQPEAEVCGHEMRISTVVPNSPRG